MLTIRIGRAAPELILLSVLLAFNAFAWAGGQVGLISPETAAMSVGVMDVLGLGLNSLRILIAKPERFSLWHFYSAFAAASYGAYGVSGAPELSDPAWVVQILAAYAYVKVGLAAMWIGGEASASRSVNLRQIIARWGTWISDTAIHIAWGVVAIRWGLQIVAFSQGIVISGTAGHMGELGPIANILVMLLPVAQVASLITTMAVVANSKGRTQKIWLVLLGLEIMGAAVLSGRRVMLGLVCLAIVVWRLSERARTISLRTAVVGGILIALIIGIAWPFFFYMRIYAVNEEGLGQEAYRSRVGVFITEVLPGALSTFSLGESYVGDSAYAENVTARVTLTSYFGQIIEASDQVPFMYGEVGLSSLLANVPKAIWWTKPEFDVEDQVNAHYGLARIDSPSTYVGQSYADFGLMGVIFYSVLYGGFLSLALAHFSTARFLFTKVVILAILFSMVCEVESEMSSMLSWARWWLIVVVIDAMIAAISSRPAMQLPEARRQPSVR